MPTLHLTVAEQALLETLSAELRAKASVELETLTFVDNDQHRESRLRNMQLQDPTLKRFQDEAKSKAYSPEDLLKMAETVDLSSISKDDVMELAFAWGPDVFTSLIAEAIPAAKTGQDLQEIADLSDLRHGLLLAFNHSR